ncbi:MAG: hypothetical protein WB989_18060 [Mycobacterium sp.]
MPITVFGSTYLPRFVSFAAAQAMGALNLLIILSLTIPTGWRIGLLRIEDIAVGAAVGMGDRCCCGPGAPRLRCRL